MELLCLALLVYFHVYREWVLITDDIKLLAKYILCEENFLKVHFTSKQKEHKITIETKKKQY